MVVTFSKVQLKNFAGVKESEEPIKLDKFTVLIGANNSAKTTLLLALYMLTFNRYSVIPFLKVNKKAFLETYLDKDLSSLIYFYSGVGEAQYVLTDGREIILRVFKDHARLYVKDRAFSSEESLSIPDLAEVVLGNRDAELLGRAIVFIPHSRRFERDLMKGLAEGWEDVQIVGAHVDLVKALVEEGVISDEFTEVTLQRDYLVVRKEVNGRGMYVKLDDQGDGVKRFLLVGLWLEALKPRVVLWDDFEASAHPSLVKEALAWLAKHDWQVVISTHSIDVLHELVMIEPKGTLVISLRKDKGDRLSFKAYTVDEVEDLFKKGLDIRKLLTGGKVEVHG